MPYAPLTKRTSRRAVTRRHARLAMDRINDEVEILIQYSPQGRAALETGHITRDMRDCLNALQALRAAFHRLYEGDPCSPTP